MLTSLGNFCNRGFTLVCATSTVAGPIQSILMGSKRRRVNLPCKGLDPPMVNGTNVFPKDVSPILDAVISDCGGHGRALEELSKFTTQIINNPSAVRTFVSWGKVSQ